MDEYLNQMEHFSPINNTTTTGIEMGERIITEVNSIPNSTALTEDLPMDDIPTYTAPKTIEVKRYRLRK